MALYFFHLSDGRETLIDPDGREVEDESLLGEMAVNDARAIISHDALTGRIHLNQCIQVRDSTGRLVLQVEFRDVVTITD